MSRFRFAALLPLSLLWLACKAAAPPSGELPRRPADGSNAVLTAPGETIPADPREAILAATVLDLLENKHLVRKKLDDDVSRDAFTAYIKALDAGKMFLLRSDVDGLAGHTDKIDDEFRLGVLALAHSGATTFTARVAIVDQLVTDLLANPLDLTNEEYFEIDPDKVERATSDAELRDRWRRRLELEVLEKVAAMEARLEAPEKSATPPDANTEPTATPIAQIPTTREGRETKAREDLTKSYASRFARLRTSGPLDAASDLVNAVASVLDPHTTYMPPADKANFDIQMTGSLEGIGAVLRERDHYIEVTELVPGGASWRQGQLAAGDIILAVAQQGKDPVDVVDMRIDEVVKMIRGKKGTIVDLRIQKPTGDVASVAITRDVVVLEEAYARGAVLSRKGLAPVGYIYLPSFYGGRGDQQRTAAGDVKTLLIDMKRRKIGSVVLDVRGNGGGFLNDAVEMTGVLIDRGPVVQVQATGEIPEILTDDISGSDYDGLVVVLVDRFSASASEILAGALQDYRRAVIVGTSPTHGKGTVQSLADLDRATRGAIELGVLKLTIQQFFRVSGASTQLEGVTPDILLPDPAGHLTDTGERSLEHAIPWSKIAPADHTTGPTLSWLPEVAKRSSERVKNNETFAKVTASSELLRARQKDTLVPLARPTWETRRHEQRKALEATTPALDKEPARFSVVMIGETSAPVAPRPGGKSDDRASRWRDGVARDPWIEESVLILSDIARSAAATPAQ